jgi:hypothetical protein
MDDLGIGEVDIEEMQAVTPLRRIPLVRAVLAAGNTGGSHGERIARAMIMGGCGFVGAGQGVGFLA